MRELFSPSVVVFQKITSRGQSSSSDGLSVLGTVLLHFHYMPCNINSALPLSPHERLERVLRKYFCILLLILWAASVLISIWFVIVVFHYSIVSIKSKI